MPLTRKLRKAGGSLAITIPGDFVKAMDLKEGDLMVIKPEGDSSLRIHKHNK